MMSKTKNKYNLKHNREFFYKYVNVDTALKTLKTLTGKWSSPLLFKDPFDTQYEIGYDFNLDDAKEPLLNEIIHMVFSDEEHTVNRKSYFYPIFIMARLLRDKVPKEKLRKELIPSLNQGIADRKRVYSEMSKWWHEYIRNIRVYCITEELNNLFMWSFYSDSHKGAVIKLKCLPEFDTALCAAVPVIYSAIIPTISSMEDYIKHLTAQQESDFRENFLQYVRTKSEHLVYEREWRIIGSKSIENGMLYEFKEFLPQEIESVYLGCKIDEKKRDEISNCLNGDLSNVLLYQGKKKKREFGLEFEKIN